MVSSIIIQLLTLSLFLLATTALDFFAINQSVILKALILFMQQEKQNELQQKELNEIKMLLKKNAVTN